jgi:hypothetical protein
MFAHNRVALQFLFVLFVDLKSRDV